MAGRAKSPDGSAISYRVSRCGTAAACARSKSCLKGVTRGDTSVDVCAHGGIVVADALVCKRYSPRQFPLRPYRCLHSEVSRGPDIPRPAETLMRTEVVLPDQPGGTNM